MPRRVGGRWWGSTRPWRRCCAAADRLPPRHSAGGVARKSAAPCPRRQLRGRQLRAWRPLASVPALGMLPGEALRAAPGGCRPPGGKTMLMRWIVGGLLALALALSRVAAGLSAAVAGMELPPLASLGAILVIYVILGCFMDS